ncbi:Macrophage infectivity potentiator-related protein [Minicystis rosea]|nr:Macrophage infectivity potentiator-related protein [Minicystis rosea]
MTSTIDRGYRDLDETTAPDAARPILTATRAQFGFVPSAVARLVASPALFAAFRSATSAFDRTSLDTVEREVVIMAYAREVGCDLCVALHTGELAKIGKASIAAALAAGETTGDPRLDALAHFTRALAQTRGDVDLGTWESFLAAGYTRAQALEVVLGVGAYTMSTFANRLTGAPVDLPSHA